MGDVNPARCECEGKPVHGHCRWPAPTVLDRLRRPVRLSVQRPDFGSLCGANGSMCMSVMIGSR